ncbi:MAG: hypothetical protein HY543_06055 [Deltaproteobacteria bacterium]|nr:hypothetical protein [Deltaproteobacteria bacterium]
MRTMRAIGVGMVLCGLLSCTDETALPVAGGCPAGQSLVGGVCQSTAACPEGQAIVDGICATIAPTPVPVSTPPSTECPEGQTLVNGACAPTSGVSSVPTITPINFDPKAVTIPLVAPLYLKVADPEGDPFEKGSVECTNLPPGAGLPATFYGLKAPLPAEAKDATHSLQFIQLGGAGDAAIPIGSILQCLIKVKTAGSEAPGELALTITKGAGGNVPPLKLTAINFTAGANVPLAHYAAGKLLYTFINNVEYPKVQIEGGGGTAVTVSIDCDKVIGTDGKTATWNYTGPHVIWSGVPGPTIFSGSAMYKYAAQAPDPGTSQQCAITAADNAGAKTEPLIIKGVVK